MTIPKGTLLGPYEIEEQIGAGGMGAVYLAVDSRLERKVAIKILPTSFASNPQLLARFEREAKTISSLSHPNICVLHDVGRAELPASQVEPDSVSLSGDVTVHYLVMEHLEGESLADRLARGPLPLHEVLRVGRQIADALDKAHRQGIVHRDLKPGNVMLTKTGAKLLDFGLAKADAVTGSISASEATVAKKPLTQEGTILGTFQYMAPEQLEGLEADARTDIFALGCVLYEMATGRRAFQGETRTSLIAAIVTGEPQPISELQPLTPPALEHVIRKCLSKDPDDRWQSTRDVFLQLEWASEAGSHAGLAKAVAGARRTRLRTATLLAILGWAVALGALWLYARKSGTADVAPFHSSVLPSGLPAWTYAGLGTTVLSPDGSRIVYRASSPPRAQLSVYDFTTGESKALDGTEGGTFPFWSPDGRWIGFFASGKLRKIEADGGATQTLADAVEGRGGSWSSRGVIVFAPDIVGPLLKIPENGGSPEPATAARDKVTNRNPSFLPDGERFLFVERDHDTSFGRTMIGALDGREPKEILNPGSNASYAAGHLLFVRDKNLFAQAFDPDAERAEGALIPIAKGISYYNPRDIGDFSVSGSAILTYRFDAPTTVVAAWFDREGREIQSFGEPSIVGSAAVTRDLGKVAISRGANNGLEWDLWILDTQSGQMTRATFFNASSDISCAFSPDGERLVASTGSAVGTWKRSTTWIQPVSGSRTDEVVLEGTNFYPSDWSRDGQVILGGSQRTDTRHDITWVDLGEKERRVQNLVQTQYTERDPVFSPDSRWVAYHSDETGRPEVYVVDFPNARTKKQVSRAGGDGAIWSVNGTELYFRSPEGRMAAPVRISNDGIEIGTPEKMKLSDANVRGLVAGDGRRFLGSKASEARAANPIQVIRNWTATP
jgi:Tol biopolymer transport system component